MYLHFKGVQMQEVLNHFSLQNINQLECEHVYTVSYCHQVHLIIMGILCVWMYYFSVLFNDLQITRCINLHSGINLTQEVAYQ